jgi:precorrin-4/cobalt-precorrin-4 C11-methyltransferase
LKGAVVFVGAGPGDPGLITVAGSEALAKADVVLYAGSLVNPELLKYAKKASEIFDTAGMNLDETTRVCLEAAGAGKSVVRLHTGDPSLYGAILEQMLPLEEAGIETSVIPGVSSAFASAAALRSQLTLPGMSQTVIFTRLSGRTPVPESEGLEKLAATGATLCVFLSVDRIAEVVAKCLEGGRSPDTPAAVVSRASWPDQSFVTGTLSDIAGKVSEAGFTRQSMIIVGDPLGPRILGSGFTPSKLYDSSFTHGYREGGK